MDEIIGKLGGLILFIGFLIYLRAIVKKEVRSNRVTWGVWVLVNTLFCASYYRSVGLVANIWVPLVYLIGTVFIFFALLRYGEKGEWSWVEKFTLVVVPVILVFWFVSDSAIGTLTFTLMIDILGAVPLIATVWKDPSVDYAPAWYFGSVSNLLNLFAVEKWDYANASYPVYLATMTTIVAFIIHLKQHRNVV